MNKRNKKLSDKTLYISTLLMIHLHSYFILNNENFTC